MIAAFALATACVVLALGGGIMRWAGADGPAGMEDTSHHVGELLIALGVAGATLFAAFGFVAIAIVAWKSRRD